METDQAQTARVTIARTLERDLGMREVRIWLDDQVIATLRNKQSVSREVAPGRHTLRAHNTMVGKQIEFELAAGEHGRFATANVTGCGSSLLFLVGAGPIYLTLERAGDEG